MVDNIHKNQIFSKDTLYKIVYKDDQQIKTPKAHILEESQNFLKIQFLDGFVRYINHNVIITIAEVKDGDGSE